MDMDRGARAWVYRTAQKHFWRVCRWYDLDDMVQDGYLHWARLTAKYPDVTDRPHMMRLFQITYINHIHDLAKNRTRQMDDRIADMMPAEVDPTAALERLWIDRGEDPEFAVRLQQAPEPIKRLLALLSSEDGRRRLSAVYRRKRGGIRESLNERLCRLTGQDPGAVDVEELCRSYFA